jgi:hypothetical protein
VRASHGLKALPGTAGLRKKLRQQEKWRALRGAEQRVQNEFSFAAAAAPLRVGRVEELPQDIPLLPEREELIAAEVPTRVPEVVAAEEENPLTVVSPEEYDQYVEGETLGEQPVSTIGSWSPEKASSFGLAGAPAEQTAYTARKRRLLWR